MKTIKKILCILLCAAMVLSLAACGGKTENGTNSGNGNSAEGSGNGSGSGSGNGSGSGSAAEDTYIYVPEYVKIATDMDGYPSGLLYSDGRFLTNFYGKIGEAIPEGVTPEWEGQYDIYGDRFLWINLDGTVEPLTAYEPLPAPTFEEGVEGSGSSYVNQYILTPDGGVAMIAELYSWWYDGPEDVEMYSDAWYEGGYYEYQHNVEEFFLRLLNEDGSERACIPLNGLRNKGGEASLDMDSEVVSDDVVYPGVIAPAEEDYFYINGFAVDAAGNFFILSDVNLYVLDGEGKLLKTLTTEYWFNSISTLADGRAAVTIWDDEGQKMIPIDPATLELDNEHAFALGNYYYGGGSTAVAGSEYDFLYTNGSNLMGFRLADGSTEKILNWINCDVDPSNMGNAYLLPDGRIVTISTEWNSDYSTTTNEFIFLKKVPASSAAQKKVITLATQSLDWNMQGRIVKFNRTNPDYRIELRDYSEYNTEADYSAGVTKLTTELLSGNMPDILDLNGLPVGQLQSKGVLTDLYPMLNADAELNGQILEGVLKALENGGKLYRIASSFQLFTVMGAARVVGDKPGWTLKDYQLALSNMPEGCDPFNMYMTRDTIFHFVLNMNMSELVDWETGKCAFDTGLFADLLKFAAQFPETYEWDEDYMWSEEDEESYRIATGRQMLMYTWLYDFQDWQYYDAMFGGDSTCVGFPVSEGTGNAFQFNEAGYGITVGCSDPDAAWQFIRQMLTESYQEEYVWQFPTNKNAFQKLLEDRMTPRYQTDMNGNYVLDENGEKIEIKDMWGMAGGSVVEIGALTQEQADEILDVINSTTRVYDYENELYEVINTDCQAFFAGQKSAEEVAKLLQSKMTIYVNEQR